MKTIKYFAFFLVFIICVPSFAFVPPPTPTITGSTGVIRMPSADVIPYKNINFGLDTGPMAFVDRWKLLYKMSLGTFQGMELGCLGEDDQQGGLKEGVFINMKYSLATDTSPYPLLLAIGVENMTSKTISDVFMVATRYIPNGSRLHFGFVGDFIENKFRPLGALGYDCPAFNERTYFLTDLFAGEKVFQLDIGFRWYMSDSIAFNISGINVLTGKDIISDPEQTDKYRDPKMVLFGFSWINPL